MERLSLLDAEFLHLEDGLQHLHIAGVSIFAGPPPSFDDLAALLRAKLHLIPRYRQRVRTVPLELGRPVWVDDPGFDLAHHLRHTALPAPRDDQALCALMGRLMSQPLDRDRPLWEIWLVEGLDTDRWALICKVHHCMVDGVSGVDLLTVLLDVSADVDLPEPVPWEPEPEPRGAAKVLDAWGGLASDVARMASRMPDVIRHPLDAAQTAAHTGEGLATFVRHLGTTPPLSIEGSIGPHRRWSHAEVALAEVKAVRRALGGTVNDVVLAAVSAGLRHYLLSRGDDPDEAVVRTLVPVSVRPRDSHGVLDNRVSAILCELPVHLDDPRARLEAVRQQMGERKEAHMAEAGEVVTTIGALAPPMVIGTVSRLATRLLHQLPQRSVTTVTTNVPGPQFPLYCLGREMLAHLPFVPISHGVRVGIAILSYHGTISFGVTGDEDHADDVDLLAEAIEAGVAELVAAADQSAS